MASLADIIFMRSTFSHLAFVSILASGNKLESSKSTAFDRFTAEAVWPVSGLAPRLQGLALLAFEIVLDLEASGLKPLGRADIA